MAALLLQEPQFYLEYESYAARKQPGPDFTVTFKTHIRFNVEVRRIRSGEWSDEPQSRVHKLMAVLCDKVRQIPPSVMNVLWLRSDGALSVEELGHSTARLRQLAEQKTEDFFTQRGFTSANIFLKQYQQTSAIILQSAETTILWLNPLARHPLPSKLANTLQRLLRPS